MAPKIKKALKSIARKIIRKKPKAYIPRPDFLPQDSKLKDVLLISCANNFNQDLQSANALMREGFARGWAEVCGPAKLVSTPDIIKEIDNYDNPAVFISQYDFGELAYPEIQKLQNVNTFVWVDVHPRKLSVIAKMPKMPAKSIELALGNYPKVMYAEPKFVWNSVGVASREYYQGWIDDGLTWETIFPAVDTARYYPDPNPDKYGHIKIAYVGGYWGEKGQSFELYFKPWEDIFYPFGYNEWPFKNYSGGLTAAQERQLYSSAGLIPLVHGPYGWLVAEILERYFKAPYCKAFCIADQNPSVRDVYNEDEMIQAESHEHFHDLVRDYLDGKIDVDKWREKGYQAVKERHLYKHRALQIKNALLKK